jgi:dethiobiotin synthetase
MQRGLFVTGTDTGVGKTVVTCLLTRALRRQGRAVRVCKPVATGASREGSQPVSDDTRLLAEAADDPALEEITPWVFAEPAAPPVAARQVGVRLSLEAIAAAVRRRETAGATLLVEGVGGLLCPLTDDALVADLARELGLPLVIVARRSLGTLNHTLLTVEAARTRGLAVAGVVVSETTPVEGLAEETNVEELGRRLPVPVLAVVPHGTAADPEGWRILTELSCKR